MTLHPSIAVVGFGMSGLGFTHALRNAPLFAEVPDRFRPEIAVFEAGPHLGGKVAPRNLGAQFLDADYFYPLNRIVEDLKVKTHPPRPDYDLAPFALRSGRIMEGRQFAEALQRLRESARLILHRGDWENLDQRGAVDLIRDLQSQGVLDEEECEAMEARLLFEEGTREISALSFAINLAKSRSPMERIEVIGGLHRLVEAEKESLLQFGARILTATCVRRVEVLEKGVRLFFEKEEGLFHEDFDFTLLAVSPEHYAGIEISGARFPFEIFSRMRPARITKTNLRFRGTLESREIANHRFAMWSSPPEGDLFKEPVVTFFHGWEGTKPLKVRRMRDEVLGRKDPHRLHAVETRTWDGEARGGGVPHGYTTMPAPGQGLGVVRLALDQFLFGVYDQEPLRAANHLLGLGCYTRDAALAGEWAAISILRSLGLNIEKALQRTADPEAELLGVTFSPRYV
jgi:hypothetical protein